MRWIGSAAAVVVGLLAAAPAHALTDPLPGAFASPVPVPAPFPAGSMIRILSGYGPAKGSSLHADTDACCKANDHYALDLVYDDQPSSGLGLPIVAPWAGEVVRAGWATEGWANYGLRVILRHDLGDGQVYHTLYAHMNAIDPAVVEGGMVAAGQVLGELGQSCQGAQSCGSFSTPHLHWAVHRGSMVGGSGTGGSYGGNAVVPEPLSGYEDLMQGMVLEIGEPECGDGVCSGGEDGRSCPADCPSCAAIGPAGRTIEETDVCFVRSGSPQYWYDAGVGSAGALVWTHAVDAARPDNTGRWELVFEQAGAARVETYVEAGFAGSMQAAYRVAHAGGTSEVVIDQSSAAGWVELGTFDFQAGEGQSITLADNTGEPFDAQRVLAFDAVRVTPLDAGGDDGSGDTGADGSDGGATSPGDGDGEGTGGGDPSAGDDAGATGGDAGLDGGGLPGPRGDADPGGCACTPAAPPRGGWLGGLMLLLLGVGRRSGTGTGTGTGTEERGPLAGSRS